MDGPFDLPYGWGAESQVPCWAPSQKVKGGDLVAIPDNLLSCVLFMYKTRDNAERHVREGGTAFVVAKTIEGLPSQRLPYLVSCRHVVCEGAASVVRVNRRDGQPPDVFETEPTEWMVHPTGDIAVRPAWDLAFGPKTHKVSYVTTEDLLTEKYIAENDIGVGDEAFMVGRFMNHQGLVDNLPAARFGCISIMVSPIKHPTYGRDEDAFAVEMRSRTGFSGSPVWTFGTPFTTLKKRNSKQPVFAGLLGVNWGYVIDEFGENTWLNGVTPAWKVLEVINSKEMRRLHDEQAKESIAAAKGRGEGVQLALATEPDEPTHRELFNRLLGAAVKPPKSSDGT